jgi:thiamine biosynthesis lipoprotein
MLSSSPPALIERAKPLFGTIVRVRAVAAQDLIVQQAVSAAFEAMRDVHFRMSFHDETSDVSRLNRAGAGRAIPVDAHMISVLRLAVEIAEASDGVFDPAIAPLAVAAGDLPYPADAPSPDSVASWCDIEIDEVRGTVLFRRPLWIDLGGIAKGYGVDLACKLLRDAGIEQGMIDAGGDLRVFGPRAERVLFDAEASPLLEIEDGAVAGSSTMGSVRGDVASTTHIDGRSRGRVLPKRFAGVVAPSCVVADALTKIVLADGADAASVLDRYDAFACLYEPDQGWRTIGTVR